MQNIPIVEEADASKDVAAVYADFQRRMGFPHAPNFIKTQGHSLAVTRGTWALVQNVLVGGALPRTVKEMMFAAISHERQCAYCEAAHLACCRMLGVDPAALALLVTDLPTCRRRRCATSSSSGSSARAIRAASRAPTSRRCVATA